MHLVGVRTFRLLFSNIAELLGMTLLAERLVNWWEGGQPTQEKQPAQEKNPPTMTKEKWKKNICAILTEIMRDTNRESKD